jgi:peptide/nickel transport system ATP-binding protein
MRVPVANSATPGIRETCKQPAGNLVQVQELTVRFCEKDRDFTVLDRVNFDITPREIVGLLGESGCGKTTIGLSLLGLLPDAARVTSGSVFFRGRDLSLLSESELREIRGKEIAMIYQDSSVLNPVIRVGDQVREVLRAHRQCTVRQAREESEVIFAAMGLRDFDRIYKAYPHQLSGGQRQRIVIAQALICRPHLVIADEAIASVDQNAALEILDFMKELKDSAGTSFLFISHDPDILAGIADRILVMYAGQVVEDGSTSDICSQPLHPYTEALLQCATQHTASKDSKGRRIRLPCIPGQPPDSLEVLTGCSFSRRCRDRMESCDSRRPQQVLVSSHRSVRCFKYEGG